SGTTKRTLRKSCASGPLKYSPVLIMANASISPRVLELLRFTESHNRHTEALARATGEHFNIFHILRVGHLEVTTHSPILGELLNPKGKHGQGAAFLRLFLAQFDIHGFDPESEKAKMD